MEDNSIIGENKSANQELNTKRNKKKALLLVLLVAVIAIIYGVNIWRIIWFTTVLIFLSDLFLALCSDQTPYDKFQRSLMSIIAWLLVWIEIILVDYIQLDLRNISKEYMFRDILPFLEYYCLMIGIPFLLISLFMKNYKLKLFSYIIVSLFWGWLSRYIHNQ